MSKRSSCIGSLITATKWLPVLVSATIFIWGWYAYNFQVVFFSMTSIVQQILCLILFHIIYVFSFWSYVQTIFTPFGKIPSKFFLSHEISEDLAKAPSDQHRDEILSYVVKRNDLPVACRTYLGGMRYCEKCNLIKPDRCHHCSICGVCILKMDHHCPWINNCVSFTNYKFFVLFLGYTFALCLFVGSTTFPYFLKYWSMPDASTKPLIPVNSSDTSQISTPEMTNMSPYSVPFSVKFHILFLFFVSTMLSFGVIFLLGYHVHLLLYNRSTLEAFRPPLMTYGPDRNAFNLGKKENFLQLFGRSKLLWFVPLFTTEGSGFSFDQRPQLGPGDEEVRQELLHHPTNNNVIRPNTRANEPNKDTEV